MDEEAELRKTFDEVRNKLLEMQTKRHIEENEFYLHKFFKYRNSYGGNEPGKTWWLYFSVRGMDENGVLSGFSFQTDFQGKIEVTVRDYITSSLLVEEISSKEFWDEFDVMFNKVKQLTYE